MPDASRESHATVAANAVAALQIPCRALEDRGRRKRASQLRGQILRDVPRLVSSIFRATVVEGTNASLAAAFKERSDGR